jgi:CRP/FNR family transcriptional regulator, cyclic AMP receptor protein
MLQQARIEALQQMPIFGGIRADVLQGLLQASAMVCVAATDFFFHEDDQAESMFVLEAGEVEVLKRWEGGVYLLGRLHQGDCFGEMALMDMSPRSASVRALQACSAIELSTATLYKLYETDIEQFALIQMNLGREVSRRLRQADERLFRAKVGALEPLPEAPFPLT